MVNPFPVRLHDMPHGRLNGIDLQPAIELLTPTYQMLLVPESTLRAGYRLLLHWLSTEMLHGLLLQLKAPQAGQSARD